MKKSEGRSRCRMEERRDVAREDSRIGSKDLGNVHEQVGGDV